MGNERNKEQREKQERHGNIICISWFINRVQCVYLFVCLITASKIIPFCSASYFSI